MEMEVAEIRLHGQEQELTRKKKLDLEIEIAEIEKRTKLNDERRKLAEEADKEGERYLALYRTFKGLQEIHTDVEIAEKFPAMKKFCK